MAECVGLRADLTSSTMHCVLVGAECEGKVTAWKIFIADFARRWASRGTEELRIGACKALGGAISAGCLACRVIRFPEF